MTEYPVCFGHYLHTFFINNQCTLLSRRNAQARSTPRWHQYQQKYFALTPVCVVHLAMMNNSDGACHPATGFATSFSS